MIQLHNNVNILKQLSTNLPESSAVLVDFFGNRIVVVVIYVPPRYDKMSFVEDLGKELETLSAYTCPIVICVDFNIDVILRNKLCHLYQNAIISNGFELISIPPTRLTETSTSCIDHFFTRNICDVSTNVLDDQSFSDHYPLLLKFDVGLLRKSNPHHFRDFSFLNKERTLNQFRISLEDKLLSSEIIGVNDVNNTFQSSLFEVLCSFSPLKK